MNVNVAKTKKKGVGNRKNVIINRSHRSERKLSWGKKKKKKMNGNKPKIREGNQWI
jgi:hypothetical protein